MESSLQAFQYPAWPERRHVTPDGRAVHAVYEGEPVGWVLWLDQVDDARAAARAIEDALADLLDPQGDDWPDWFTEAVSELGGRDTNEGVRYPCPCCEQPTLEEPPPGTYDICGICGWEDDPLQFSEVDFRGGANQESLRQARGKWTARTSADDAS
jgi:hypothetical protein